MVYVPVSNPLFSFALGPTHVANPKPMLSGPSTYHIHRARSVPVDFALIVMEGLVKYHYTPIFSGCKLDLLLQALVPSLLEISVIFGQKQNKRPPSPTQGTMAWFRKFQS